MPTVLLFNVHLILGYVACLLVFGTYILPRFRSMDRFAAQRVIATIHSFRFYGLVFILPGVVGNLPPAFASLVAWGDFATAVLALAALLLVRSQPLFWFFVGAFDVVGIVDLLSDYYNAVRLGVPLIAGQMGAAYIIPVLYVPMLMITHVVSLYWLLRRQPRSVPVLAGNSLAS